MKLESDKLNDSALSESAQSILKARPSFWVRHGGALVLIVLIISSTILFLIKYTPTSESILVFSRKISGTNSVKTIFKSKSLKLFHLGEKVEIVSGFDKRIKFFGVVDSIYKHSSYQYLSISIDSNLSNQESKSNAYIIRQESEFYMNLIMNRKIQNKN